MTHHPVIETTENCRFCLMCRHVCPVPRVTFSEATSPHGWALLVASARRGLVQWDADSVDLLYKCADCGLCQANCVTDQPLPQALVAARAEVASAGRAPAVVVELDARLRRWGSVYGESEAGEVERMETALLVGAAAWHRERAEVLAARRLLHAAGFEHGLLAAGRDDGYLPYTLGLHETARALASATLDELRRAGVRRVLTLSPQQTHALHTVYPLVGAPLPDDVEVVELPALLAAALDGQRLRLRPVALDVAYYDPTHAPRFDGRWRAPRRLLAAATSLPLREGFWRERRANAAGDSGGLPWTQPELAARLARAALADAAASGATTVVTDSPETLAHLREHADGVQVKGLYEVLAEGLEARD